MNKLYTCLVCGLWYDCREGYGRSIIDPLIKLFEERGILLVDAEIKPHCKIIGIAGETVYEGRYVDLFGEEEKE